MANYPDPRNANVNDFIRFIEGMREPQLREPESRSPRPDKKIAKHFESLSDGGVTWDKVIGHKDAKEALRNALLDAQNHQELYQLYDLKAPKGVLLFGPPGNGKTMLAKACAHAVGAQEIAVVNAAELTSMWVGETEKNITALFEYAREYYHYHKKQLIIFFDEADTLFSQRNGMSYLSRMTNQFLTELDGLRENGAFIILATNRPGDIDEALLRDGRIDRKIHIGRPSFEDCTEIIRATVSGMLGAEIEDLTTTAVECLFDPAYVLEKGATIKLKKGKKTPDVHALNFVLSDIISGAMAAGVIPRAKRIAFARDRDAGTRTGTNTLDVIAAVRQLYEENKDIPHPTAFQEFIERIQKETEE